MYQVLLSIVDYLTTGPNVRWQNRINSYFAETDRYGRKTWIGESPKYLMRLRMSYFDTITPDANWKMTHRWIDIRPDTTDTLRQYQQLVQENVELTLELQRPRPLFNDDEDEEEDDQRKEGEPLGEGKE